MKSTRPRIEIYSIDQSPLLFLGTQRKLARLLRTDLDRLRRLAENRIDFYWTKTDVINGKTRHIACPIGAMRKVHERLKALLNRIQQPDYLYSPRRGRSAPMNAAAHIGNHVAVKLDIRQFYPSTTDEHVFRFLHHRLGLPPDVAGLLTKLATFDGRLPFGSPLSPVLCTLVHRDMFDGICSRCEYDGHKVTVWVDDIAISGQNAASSLIYDVRAEIARKGLRSHKIKKRAIKKGVTITGVHISKAGPVPANKIHLKIKQALEQIKETVDAEARLSIIKSLIGWHNHCSTIYPISHPTAERFRSRKAWLHQERRRLEHELTDPAPIEPGPQAEAA